MQHHRDGAAALAVEPADQVEHLDLVGEVEERRRLVEQHQVGVLGERHGDPGALALAAGELVDGAVAQVPGVGQPQRLPRRPLVVGRPLAEPALVRVAAATDQVADEQSVRRDRALGEQGEPLGDLAGGHRVDGLAVQEHLPPVGLSSRARVRSRVDFPQPLGPTMVVT